MLKRWIELHTNKTAWLIDIEFLLSNYVCTWGSGCKGINTKSPDLGCCANGAYMTNADVALMKRRVPELNPQNWQNYTENWMISEINEDDGELDYKTAVANPDDDISGCVFANRPGFAAGTGCALHAEALRRGENPMDWKPEICWHMPLEVDFQESANLHILRQYHWAEGIYDWFCAHDDANWCGENPIYQTMAPELERLVGLYGDETAYPQIKALLDEIWRQNHKQPTKKRIPVTVAFN